MRHRPRSETKTFVCARHGLYNLLSLAGDHRPAPVVGLVEIDADRDRTYLTRLNLVADNLFRGRNGGDQPIAGFLRLEGVHAVEPGEGVATCEVPLLFGVCETEEDLKYFARPVVVRVDLRYAGSTLTGTIAGRLPTEYAADESCRVSHEAIYQWVYAQPVSTLARELISLRTGRKARKGGRRPPPAPRIREPVYIDARPAEVTGRQVPGHWEGDLVIGKDGKTAVATLVERTSRFLILVPLTGRDSLTVGEAIIAATGGLPAQIRRSLTWDCGAEMARHATITATGLPVFFAHPHSPWERGSNENLNRIVREYFPKGVEISSDPKYLAMVACDINDRPRKIHNWKKPSELFTELVESNASTG